MKSLSLLLLGVTAVAYSQERPMSLSELRQDGNSDQRSNWEAKSGKDQMRLLIKESSQSERKSPAKVLGSQVPGMDDAYSLKRIYVEETEHIRQADGLAKLIKEGNELPRPRQQIVFIDPEPTPSKHLILGEQVKAAQDAQRRGAEIQNWNFASKISAEQHQRLIRDFAHSAQRIEVNADRMSRRELAIAKFAIAKATAEEGKVQRILSAPTAGPKTVNLGPLEDAVGYLGKMNARAANGLPSIDYRMVNVSVRKKDGKFISGLRVYALPKDMLNEPGNYSQALIKNLLEDLTFEKLTSPSLDKIPISELQIWVGPEFSYEEMRKMVVEKKLKKYKPVHASFTSTTLELVFEAPDEVQGKGGDNE